MILNVLSIVWGFIGTQGGMEIGVFVLIGYIAYVQRTSNDKLLTQQKVNHDITTAQLSSHIKEEEKEFAGIEKKFDFLSSGLALLQTTIQTLNSAMERYAITNHEVLDDEIGQIDAVIYMSSTSVTNILKNSLLEARHSKTEVSEKNIGKLIEDIAQDVEDDRRRYHSELTTKGVSTKTVHLWEETEREAFESFMYRIIQTFKKLAEMKGNGTVDKLIERECELLRDYMHQDFMRRLKRRLSVIK